MRVPSPGLVDAGARAAVVSRLAARVAGRPVVVGPVALAGAAETVAWLRTQGCPVLVVSTTQGAGALPDDCTVLEVATPATATTTEELRLLDRLARHLPPEAVAAIEAFDPERRGLWWGSPFVTDDEPVLGRRVVAGRPAAFLALEDKLGAEEVWAAVGLDRAPHRVVALDDDAALTAATTDLASSRGAVWSGDARDGFNGGADFVRWVVDDRDAAAAAAYFKPRCDRVRVMPFLEGVPCSIHGYVLPDGTAALRPVEIAMLRSPAERRFVYSGLGTYWDPPGADREHMRTTVRAVGEHLRAAHDYRGAFGIDGVLTADGFRPTELNTRASAGLTLLAEVDRWFFTLLQLTLLERDDPGVDVGDVESLVALMDGSRTGRALSLGPGSIPATRVALDWDGARFATVPDRSPDDADNVLLAEPTRGGWVARIDPCAALSRPGDRLAAVDLALTELLDRELGTSHGHLEMAPDVRAVS